MPTGKKNARKPPAARCDATAALAAARERAWAGQHAEAIDVATRALAEPIRNGAVHVALLEARAGSYVAAGDMARAGEDAAAMLAIAERSGGAAFAAQALNCLSRVQSRSGAEKAAVATARRALAAARRSRQKPLEAQSLLRLAESQMRARASAPAAQGAVAAARRFESLADAVHRGRALWVLACAQDDLGHSADSERAAAEALALARQSGDRFGEGSALNLLYRSHEDFALRLRGLHEALEAYRAAGDVSGQAAIFNNLSLAYGVLGLHRHARRMILRTIEIRRQARATRDVINCLLIQSVFESRLGRLDAAHRCVDEATALNATLADRFHDGIIAMSRGWLAMDEGDARAALPDVESSLRHFSIRADNSYEIATLALLGRVQLALGNSTAALAATRRATALHLARERHALDVILSAAHIWWWHHQALRASGDATGAGRALATAYEMLLENIGNLSDAGLRRSVLNRIDSHRAIVRAWIAHARALGLSVERCTAHLASKPDMRGPFKRLLEIGLRLGELRNADDVAEFVIDEATEFGGPERVLLLVETPAGPQAAGSLLPPGEDPQALLQAVTPWLAEARATRLPSLRHGPQGADPLDQRSCFIAPLIAQQRLVGFLYCDTDGAFGRFRDDEADFLAMFAGQAALALDNAQWAQGLERKVEQRTAELNERVGELEVINAIQRAVSAELDFQAIADVVGDTLREVFDTGDISMRWWDEGTGAIHHLYTCEHGVRLRPPPVTPPPGSFQHALLFDRRTRRFGSVAEQEAAGVPLTPGTDRARSLIVVPLLASDRALGMVGMENHERDNAYGPADVRLLETVAASMAVALLNAKSYEAERQRSAELAIINSVQAALASKLDMQAIYDLVGDKLRDIFDQQAVLIGSFDHARDLEIFNYEWEQGHRDHSAPRTINRSRRHLIETRQPQFHNRVTPEFMAERGGQVIEGTSAPKSAMFVPMLAGAEVRGYLSIQNIDRFDAFTEADLRLLQTLAGSMSVALENARLFDETQRRAAELDTVNTVSRQLAGKLDLSALIELVGEQIRVVFKADLAYVALLDRTTGLIDFPYQFGETNQPLRYGEGLTSRIIETGAPLILNFDVNRRSQELWDPLESTCRHASLSIL